MKIRLNEQQFKKLVAESVKKVLNETTLDYDMDNFSGNWSRGNRYDILVDGEVYYHDVSEEEVDRLYDDLSRKPYLGKVQIVDLNDDDTDSNDDNKEEYVDGKRKVYWNSDISREYTVGAMIRSDMNPLTQKFEANNIEEAIKKARDYFSRFSGMNDKAKDVDIFYVKHNGYDEYN